MRRNGKWQMEARGPVMPVTFPISTDLDGELHASLDYNPGGASLVAIDPETGQIVATGATVSLVVCGSRHVDLRVVGGRPGRFSVSVTRP